MRLVVVGTSMGGIETLSTLLGSLQADFPLPVAIVQHMGKGVQVSLADLFRSRTKLRVYEGEPLQPLQPGSVYLAPVDYHMLIEKDMTISLSLDEKVNYSRPSIDVLFESAAYSVGADVIGVLLTGASRDGATGVKAIKEAGGFVVVESPETAICSFMPRKALEVVKADYVLPVNEIGSLLCSLTGVTHEP